MPMHFFPQQYQEVILTLLKKLFKIYFLNFLLVEGWGRSAIGIFYPSGEPILLHLLRCDPFAVDDHSCMGHASHLQQPRLVNNPGLKKGSIFGPVMRKSSHQVQGQRFPCIPAKTPPPSTIGFGRREIVAFKDSLSPGQPPWSFLAHCGPGMSSVAP